MPRPLHERGFEVNGKYPPYRLCYEIDKSGQEKITIDRESGSVIIKVYDSKISAISGNTNQALIYQDKGLENSGEEDLLGESESLDELIQDSDSEIPFYINPLIELPKEIKDINYDQAYQLYLFVKKMLDVDKKLKEYIPRFSSSSELTLFNILGIDKCEDIFNNRIGDEDAS
ncbi:MAG: hypothetical protein Q8N99_04780 [Nanoarchaeota archaeon]|nr:hypothetical protein [Nanoarchaeota archaeon]